MENEQQEKKTSFLRKVWRWLVPDRDEERVRRVKDGYKVILKDGELFLVFENEVVIKKLPACFQNLDTIDLIEETSLAQLQFEGLEVRP